MVVQHPLRWRELRHYSQVQVVKIERAQHVNEQSPKVHDIERLTEIPVANLDKTGCYGAHSLESAALEL